MVNNVSEEERLRASARNSFDAARAAVAGARKTAALSAAALGIVWLSGLEGTLQNVSKQERAFREINSVRQEAERKIAASYADLLTTEAEVNRLHELKAKEQSLAAKIEETKAELNQAQTTGDELGQQKAKKTLSLFEAESIVGKIEEANRESVQAEKKAGDLERAGSEEPFAMWKEAQSWRDKLLFLKADLEKLNNLSEREKRLAELKEESKTWGPDVLKAYDSAKGQSLALGREVNFELLGVKLKTPLLVAPILWSILLLGLLGYLILVRGRVVALGREGFRQLARLPSLRRESLLSAVGTLPPWSASEVVPAFASVARQAADAKSVENETWVSQVFGSKGARRTSDVLSYLIPLTALLLQLRVAWLGIELTRHLGSNGTRALTSFALIVATGAACWLAHDWFVFDDLLDANTTPIVKNRSRKLPWVLVVGLVVLGFTLALWLHPFLGIKSGLIFQRFLWVLWPLSALWVAAPIVEEYLRALVRSEEAARTRGSLMTRRNAIIVVSGFLLLVTGGLLVKRSLKPAGHNPRFRHRRRLSKTTRRPHWGVGSGFYANSRRPPLSNDRGAEKTFHQPESILAGKYVMTQLPSDFKLPIVLHYVDSRGKIWGGGRVPRGPVEKFNIFDLATIKRRTDAMPLSEGSTSSKEEESGAEPGESALIWRKLPKTPLISVGALASVQLQPVGPRVHLASASWDLRKLQRQC